MSTPSDDPTLPESSPPQPSPRPRRRRILRGIGVGVVALALIGAGVGAGMALAGTGSGPAATPAPAAPGHGARRKADENQARQSWAHRYGVDRTTMPDLAPVSAATPGQQAAAMDLLVRTEQATARYADPNVAKAAGYDLQASLARHQQKKGPGLIRRMQAIDAGTARAGAPMPMLHVPDPAARTDGKVLDPSAPETLMYGYQGHGTWTLVGVMYVANESFPQPPPDPGGPIMRWHYHPQNGGRGLMMHLFFVPGNDLAHAYAADMKS